MRKHLEILPIVAALLLAPAAAWAGLPRELTDALRQMQERRAAAPVFAETFTRDLRQWGFALPLGPEGLVLDRAAGTVPGVRQIFIPGLLLRDGVVTCEMRIARDDQGYLMFRADEDADAAYQLILSTRPDGKFPSGFVKKRTLNLLYGGSLVGQSYRGVFPAEEWISVEVYFAGRNLVAVANGEPVAFYDRADTRDGCISVFNGAQPLGLRNLRAYTFQGEEPVSAYRPPRAGGDADPVLLGPPTDGLLAFPPSAFPPAGAGRAMDNGLVGALPRPGGATFSWRLDAKNKFFLDGEELIPLRTTDGVYFAQLPADVAQLRALESIRDGDLIDQIRASGLPFTPVRVRLVDYVNALGTDHDFREDPVLGGRTRILEIAGRRCRVTSPRRWLSYFSYTMGAGQPLAPHLLLAQTPNDRERNLVLRVHPPARAPPQ